MDIVTLALARKYANKKVAELAEVGFAPAIVDSLPTSNVNSHTLYLVPADDAIESNGYLEYLYINGKWECVGSTIIDFSMIGDLTQLTTEDKTTLVAAINEVFASSNTAINEMKSHFNEQINTTNNSVNTKINEIKNSVNEQINTINSSVNTKIDETKNYVNEQINTTNNYINEQINTTNNYVDTKIDETTTYINKQITQVNNNMNNRVFQGNITTYNSLTDAQKNAYDIAVVEPLAKLAEEDLSLVDSIVGGEATETVIDMSEREINEVLDNIIGTEENVGGIE